MTSAVSDANRQPLTRRHGSFQGRVGIAQRDITPPVGIYARNWGAALHDTAESVHRPLILNVLTLRSSTDESPLVLIDADLGWWRPIELFTRFQDRLLNDLQLDSPRLIFALSHTHAAAPLMEPEAELAGSALLQPWLERVYSESVAAVRTALESDAESVLDWHTGRCALAAARDLPDPNVDHDRFVCGYNPQLTADDTLVLGRITDAHGTLRATLVNYACHPTTLAWDNRAISPDFVGAMRATMERATGATSFFLQGMSGDVAPRQQYVGDVDVADRHGHHLAYSALATLHDMEPAGRELCFDRIVESGAPLAVWHHQAHDHCRALEAVEVKASLTLKEWPSAAKLEEARRTCQDRALAERLRRQRDIRRSMGDGASFPLAVHAWKLGDAVLVGCPAEAYSCLQIELRNQFPGVPLVCMNLVNGSVGYLPTAQRYDDDVYPVWQTPFARGSLERIGETMRGIVADLQR